MTAAEHPLSPEELMAYLDGELQAERATAVQSHLIGCDVCQRLSGELRGVSRDMARWQVEDAPATLMAPSSPPDGTRRTCARDSVGFVQALDGVLAWLPRRLSGHRHSRGHWLRERQRAADVAARAAIDERATRARPSRIAQRGEA